MIILLAVGIMVILISQIVAVGYAHHLQKKGESSSAVELGLRNTASSATVLGLLLCFLMWPATSQWYKVQPIGIFFELVSTNLRPAKDGKGLLPAQKYKLKDEQAAADYTYKTIHIILTACVVSALFGAISAGVSTLSRDQFLGTSRGPATSKKGNQKGPRSPWNNNRY